MSENVCFLLSPIGSSGSEVRKRSDLMLSYVIRPAAERAGYKVLRADEIAEPGLITSQITVRILEAPLVIADLSGSNPNVMYELGLRHAAGLPTIQITTDIYHLPFDISTYRTIAVDLNDLKSIKVAEQQLYSMIQILKENPDSYRSPVSSALNVRQFQRLSADEILASKSNFQESFVSVLKDIEDRMKSLERKFSEVIRSPDGTHDYSRRVFVVHGRDAELKNELARLLEHLDFDPVILHEQPDRGQTIFAKLSVELSDVGFAFVILTPDDLGALATEASNLLSRARQNVIFEHGLFAGFLSPKRVCAIRRGDVEIPSDLHGVLYKTIPHDGNIRSIALDIVTELRGAGYVVDANKLLSI